MGRIPYQFIDLGFLNPFLRVIPHNILDYDQGDDHIDIFLDH